jgi:hypothetical protein
MRESASENAPRDTSETEFNAYGRRSWLVVGAAGRLHVQAHFDLRDYVRRLEDRYSASSG